LWIDKDTEIKMNQTGQFKNIEEFKATVSGLVGHFLTHPTTSLDEKMMVLHVLRSVNLLKYQKVDDIIPYYCEALIHLSIMKSAEFLVIENEKVDFDFSKYESLKQHYIKTYDELVKLYLEKQDASKFLYKWVKFENGIYLPVDEKLEKFVKQFYSLYLKYGNEVN
jgi:hypothetical protein